MQTREVASHLKQLALLMELHGENEFKSRALANAAFRLSKSAMPLEGLSLADLEKSEGIGKGIAAKIFELQQTGTLKELDAFLGKTPAGVVQMLAIKGIGPKKVRTIWNELGAESLGELLYACNENRLVDLDGFGEKTQTQVKKSIEFLLLNSGKVHFATALFTANELLLLFEKAFKGSALSLTGAMRRACEVIECIEILVGNLDFEEIQKVLSTASAEDMKVDQQAMMVLARSSNNIQLKIFYCEPSQFEQRLFETTGSPEHLKEVSYSSQAQSEFTEESFYKSKGLSFVIPEMREKENTIARLKEVKKESIIQFSDLHGILHNHTKYSDGLNTVAEMAQDCIRNGFEYLGICDHSQTAVYAGGLKPEKVLEQQDEIDAFNEKHPEFKIFKGIESDILGDGSLDYEDEILSSFDFVVASIHSNLNMDIQKATSRVLAAVENPFTTILGHPTGRLLLAREGYPLDFKKIIDACAANQVVVELNANPYRLDIDWRWIHYALEKGVMVSINPDAHSVEGLKDMQYGVFAARKAGLPVSMCFNAKSRKELEAYFGNRRK